MPNEAHEYLQGRTTPLTTRSFNPKRYATKSSDGYVKENDDDVLTPNFKQVLERRFVFRKSVDIEAAKIHPLVKKVKKRRKFHIFPTKKSKDHIASKYPIAGPGSNHASTRRTSAVLHVREVTVGSGSQTTVFKRWLSSNNLSETESDGTGSVYEYKRTDDENPTTGKKCRETLKKWFKH